MMSGFGSTWRENGHWGSASGLSAISIAALLVASLAGAAGAADVWDDAAPAGDEAPLVLSSKHLGMTSEDVAAEVKPVASTASAEVAGEEANEWRSEPTGEEAGEGSLGTFDETSLDGADAAAADDPAAEVAAIEEPAAPADAVCPAMGGIGGFEGCIETAIRGGNGYEESARICRTLHPLPQQQAAEAGGLELQSVIE